jgi:hypothetical protein
VYANEIPEQMWVVRATDRFAVLDCASTTLGVVDCRSWHPTNAESPRLTKKMCSSYITGHELRSVPNGPPHTHTHTHKLLLCQTIFF